MWHALKPNETADRRVSLALHYIKLEARKEWVEMNFVILAHGEDLFVHFQSEAMR